MAPSEDGDTKIAVMEFDSKDDVLTALTRDQKRFGENTIEVHLEAGSTLWVTNFPATADDGYIHNLFDKVSIESSHDYIPDSPSNHHSSTVPLSISAGHPLSIRPTVDSATSNFRLRLPLKQRPSLMALPLKKATSCLRRSPTQPRNR